MSRTWTYVVAAVAAFMVSLDNLVVTTALPQIRLHLHTGISGLEWVVNAYTLTFAVLLLAGAALGDRFGRRRTFGFGMAVFTLASAAAALAPNPGFLIGARAVQGLGGAIVLPLSLTLISSVTPPGRRGAVLGLWGAVSGLAVAAGPLVGGTITQGASWQWIFWLNVPIGLVVLPMLRRVPESFGPHQPLDLRGVILGSGGLFGIVFALVRSDRFGWASNQVLLPLAAGLAVLVAFVVWERRAEHPMLPLRLFRSRTFTATNVAALFFSFGMFGSIFLLAQFLQTVQHLSPFDAGLRTLPWTAMPMLVAPIAGPLSDRIGSRPLMASGLAMQAGGLLWLASVLSPTVPFTTVVLPFILCGVGMSLFFVPVANAVLGSVEPADEGVASGANNAIRELGGVLGIAVLASVFSGQGSYATAVSFVAGTRPAIEVGGVIVAIGAVAALFSVGRRQGRNRSTAGTEELVPIPAAA